ncbi:hypothetical protein DPMN_040416 [Dreissena polymorpha]|uniref:Uncharacterized protein n=1 Tax=Dreissena polymorpha TaxID=45954 RepID=A0A9D4CWV5_DREPO|nr:hypothetical protein DPMN_040416 [Dreissena polymorpha]
MKSAKALPRYGSGWTHGKTDSKMDGRKDGQRQNNSPLPMARDKNCKLSMLSVDCRHQRSLMVGPIFRSLNCKLETPQQVAITAKRH